MRLILKNFRIIDEEIDVTGSVIIEDGIISELQPGTGSKQDDVAGVIIDGKCFSKDAELPVLMPAFVDLHAHFREPGFIEKDTAFPSEVLESASLAAAAGGFGTVVCMANTRPVIDSIEKAAALKNKSDVLGLVDLYPVLSLTKNLEGKKLSEITGLSANSSYIPLMFSEDGKDIADDGLFLAAMKEAKRMSIPISCHCDLDGEENAIRRAIKLGRTAGCHIHIGHVSTAEAIDVIRQTKAEISAKNTESGFNLTCEVMPHNLCLITDDAVKLGEKTWGRVNPPLRSEADRKALIKALTDETIDAIATDHAPHSRADKEAGAPGFSGFETAFAALYSELVRNNGINLQQLSSLMSARPARLLGLGETEKRGPKRGRILSGYRADLVLIDTAVSWVVDSEAFKSRGKNSPFQGRQFLGRIFMTLHKGRIVYAQYG